MRFLRNFTVVCMSLIGSLCATTVQADVITFEPPAAAVPRFFLTNVGIYVIPPAPAVGGYQSVLNYTASTRGAFNPFGNSPSDFLWNPATGTDTFNLNSFVIAGAWGNQTLTIEGWNDGALLFSNLLPVTTTAFTATFDWLDIDLLRIIIGTDFVETVEPGIGIDRREWTLDNIVINEALSAPEPGSIALLGVALAGLVCSRRRKVH